MNPRAQVLVFGGGQVSVTEPYPDVLEAIENTYGDLLEFTVPLTGGHTSKISLRKEHVYGAIEVNQQAIDEERAKAEREKDRASKDMWGGHGGMFTGGPS